jgi:putative membrane protein
MWPGHMWGEWWMWIIGGLMMLLFWGAIFALAFFAIRALLRSGREDSHRQTSFYQGENSLEILKQRYARGEITRDEYLEMRKELEE